MSRVAKKAKAHFAKVARLQAKGAAGRAELKRMRDVWYPTDKPTAAGNYFNPDNKQPVRA